MLVFNDLGAVDVLDVLHRRGDDVPDQMSVVGHDDSQLARLAHIDLTAVTQDTARLAEFAVGTAAERLDDGRADQRAILLEPQRVTRSTTGAPAIRPQRGSAPKRGR